MCLLSRYRLRTLIVIVIFQEIVYFIRKFKSVFAIINSSLKINLQFFQINSNKNFLFNKADLYIYNLISAFFLLTIH